MRMTGRALGCAVALCASGCFKATFIRDTNAVRGAEHDRWVDFFIFGLVGEPTFDVHQFCPDGRVAQVQTGANFGTGIVSLLTIGIYAPRKVYVTCATDRGATDQGAHAARLELTADEEGRPVAAARRSGEVQTRAMVTAAGPEAWQVSFPEVRP